MRLKPLAIDADTVTLSRADYDALLGRLEDAHDTAVFNAFDATVARLGWDGATADCLSGDNMGRILAGESPLRVWRDQRGMTQRALAASAGISPSYLADIEAGRRKGQAAVLARLAEVLRLPLETLVQDPKPRR